MLMVYAGFVPVYAGKDGNMDRLSSAGANSELYSTYSYETGLLHLKQVHVDEGIYEIKLQQMDDETFTIFQVVDKKELNEFNDQFSMSARSYCNWHKWDNGNRLNCHIVKIDGPENKIFEFAQMIEKDGKFIVVNHD